MIARLRRALVTGFFLVLCIFGVALLRPQATHAATFSLIKTATSPDIYVQFPSGRYKIHDQDTWNRWGFTWAEVTVLTTAQMNAIPQGPDITRAMRPYGSSTVYVVEASQIRAVTSETAFLLAGYQWSDVRDVEPALITLLPAAADLTTPPVVRSPASGSIYYISGGQKHHIVDQDTFNNWGFTGYVTSAYVDTIPTGQDLTKLVRPIGDPTVWVIDHGTRRALPSSDALILNGFSWSQVVDADPALIASLPQGDIFWAPTTVQVPGNSTLYYVFNSVRYPIADTDTATNWGFSRFASVTIAAAAQFPVSPSSVTRLIQTEDGTIYRITGNSYRAIPSVGIFNGYGFNWASVSKMPLASLYILTNQGILSYTTDTLNGNIIPSTSGYVGLEQHLQTTLGDTTSAQHYALTNVPAQGQSINLQNGLAGIGAFGILDPAIEKYYITMRWSYVNWFENADPTICGMDSNFPTELRTCTSTIPGVNTSQLKSWYLGKKIIVSDQTNGRKIVVAVGEAGPAIWITRERGVVAGLSPEATDYIVGNRFFNGQGVGTGGDMLTYGWAVDQTLPLGPLNE